MISFSKILVVEDEIPARKQLLKLIEKNCLVNSIETVDSVESCLELLKSGYKPELAFFDIHLSDGESFEIFEGSAADFPVIFTTAFSEYALKAFQTNGIHYLLKPITEKMFQQALEKFSRLQPSLSQIEAIIAQIHSPKSYRNRFLVYSGDKLISINEKQISYFQFIEKSVIMVLTTGQQHLSDSSLEELENELSPKDFFRLNRQIIARENSIIDVYLHLNGKLKVCLSPATQEDVFVSREKAPAFKKWLGDR